MQSLDSRGNRMRKRIVLCMGLLVLVSAMAGCGTMGMASFKMAFGNYEDAIELYEAYLEENPDSVKARNGLGFAYMKTGEIDKSITLFKEALRMEPDNSFSALRLGQAYVNVGRIDAAIQSWSGFTFLHRETVEEEVHRLLRVLTMYQGGTPPDPPLLRTYSLDASKLKALGKTDLANLINVSLKRVLDDRTCFT
jgi:tetratricopeptide (TPR) repeat protein